MAYEFECKRHPLPCSAPSCICPRKEIMKDVYRACGKITNHGREVVDNATINKEDSSVRKEIEK